MLRRIIVCVAGLLVFGAAFFIARHAPSAASSSYGGGDVALFRRIVDDLRSGVSYYDATGAMLRMRHYPTSSVFNWRTPLLYQLLGSVSVTVGRGILVALAALLLFATTRRPHPLLAPLWMLHALIVLIIVTEPIYLTEMWAGVCLGLSAIAYARQRPIEGVAWAILALFIRELAAPYCVAAMLYALWHRRWAEVRAWLIGASGYAVYYGWHMSQTWKHMRPDDLSQPSSWLYAGGVPFLLQIIHSTGLLVIAPPFVLAAVVVLMVAAWWAPAVPTHVRMGVVTYLLFFSIVGQPFNVYWGLMVGPLLALWLAHAPSGIAVLLGQTEPAREVSREGLTGS
jgi:hypothetical protein